MTTHDASDSESSRSASHDATAPLGPADEPPRQIGPYRILNRIGEGGFAIVYLAEQERPVRRRVALKLIKREMISEQVVARFEAERQALAMMDHPNVAAVYDAGVSKWGQPYFVMEHVPGIPITEHCDRHRLNIRERLELFLQACDAVHHAHQKGVIHRDIKPSNVLVSIQDRTPRVKVIDFGVAKALSHPLSTEPVVTEIGQIVGTPEYMSPEQAEMTAQDIDTRSDVYSLGVLLYELLAGTLPFDPTTLRQVAMAEVQRIIREQEPPKPSTRLSSLGESSRAIAKRHGSDPRSLIREVRGDLDWITMKAMEKDRRRRYSSASEFAADIHRHLRNEPVSAGPPSVMYRASKFVRRHRASMAGVAAVLVVLLAAIVVTSVLAVGQARARREAQVEAEKAREVVAFLRHMLEAADPSDWGRDALVVEVVDRAAIELDQGELKDPTVEATARIAIGDAYVNLGRLDAADKQLTSALQLARRHSGAQSLEAADALYGLARLHFHRDKFDQAEAAARDAVAIYEARLGRSAEKTVDTRAWLGAAVTHDGRPTEGEQILREALAAARDGDLSRSPAILTRLAQVLNDLGRHAEAMPLLIEALELFEAMGHRQSVLAGEALAALAVVQLRDREFAEAEASARAALEIYQRYFPPESPFIATNLVPVALVRQARGDIGGAAEILREAATIYENVNRNEGAATTYTHLAAMLDDAGRSGEAATLYPKIIELYLSVHEPEHWIVGNARNRYGLCLGRLGEYDQAIDQLELAYGILINSERRDLAPLAAERLADVCEQRGDLEESRRWREIARRERSSGG